jgi:hypothetical protein
VTIDTCTYTENFKITQNRNDKELRKQNPKLKFFRRRQLERIIVDTYGEARLPDSDDGRDLLCVMAHHLAQIGQGLIRTWVATWAPWLTPADLDELIDDSGSAGHLSGADELGHYIGLDDARRTRTKATTIGAIDCDQRQRARRRKRRRKLAARADREKAGSRPHSKSAEATRPWIKDGISRRTYYYRKKRERDCTDCTETSPAILSNSCLVTNQCNEKNKAHTSEAAERPKGAAQRPKVASIFLVSGPQARNRPMKERAWGPAP